MLSQHIKAESRRWAAEQQQHHPAPSSVSSSASSVFSALADNSTRSRRSSISSIASEDAAAAAAQQQAAAQFQQPLDHNGAPITVYSSLEEAVAQSSARYEADAPRRLVTPGKLYENEEDDDEIIEGDGSNS
ncbi:Uu.00g102030.m01.CDS01 [Anthostomella pinea]|uniref:Uu.00g102030.m01.CDS01 n=1 Tax=Anthostomella pinea TaxID=933095 RepID=A0AAI8V871_9PEZI|nr:Uu.00g102030.m01.CDS01 [Anthostomella pinea]